MVLSEQQNSAVFRALADPTRRAIIERLSKSRHAVSELVEPFDMSMAAVSKHLGILENAGIITREKRGRERICSLSPDALKDARDWIARYSQFWDERLDALDAALKEQSDG